MISVCHFCLDDLRDQFDQFPYRIPTAPNRNQKIESPEEAGIQYLIMDLDPSKELEALEMFADEIIKKS